MAIKTNPLKREQLKDNIHNLEGEMMALNNELNLNPVDFFPNDGLLPGISDIEVFDYDKEIIAINEDCKETLDCLSSLYLTPEYLEKKNISNIVKNDAQALSDLKFSMAMSKRSLISLMKNLDMGVNDPELYHAVGAIQKEIRDSVKMLYDTQKKIKEFYKDIRAELSTINAGDQGEADTIQDAVVSDVENTDDVYIIDFSKLNDDIEEYMDKNKNN